MNCGFSRAEYRPAPTALPLDTMVGKYRIGVMKATSRQSQIYTGIDVASSAPVLIEEFLPAKMVGRMTDGLCVLPAQSDPQSQQRFQQACRMFETSMQNRPLRKLAVIRANNTVYNVFEPMMNVPADAQCEALADNPVYFRGPDDKPLMTINMLPIPPMPRERAYDPTGTAAIGVPVRTQMEPNIVQPQVGPKTIVKKKKNKLPIILAAAGVAVIALVCLLVILLTRKTVPTIEPEPTAVVATTAPVDHAPPDVQNTGLGELHNVDDEKDKDQGTTNTDLEPIKSIGILRNVTSSDDNSTQAENGSSDSSDGKDEAVAASTAKDDENEADQSEDGKKNSSASDNEANTPEATQPVQETEPVSSELTNLESIANQLYVKVEENNNVDSVNEGPRVPLEKDNICKAEWVPEYNNVFIGENGNNVYIHVKAPKGEIVKLRIYTKSSDKLVKGEGAHANDEVEIDINKDFQVMMKVWEDVGGLKKDDFIIIENDEDNNVWESIRKSKSVSLKLTHTNDGYYMIVTYTDMKKQEKIRECKIKTVVLDGADESSGTQPVEDGQERDSHSGTGSSWVSGND